MSDEAARDLLEAVREAATRNDWSRGVELRRRGAAQVAWRERDEVVVQVRPGQAALCPTVRLFPSTGDWDCDCGRDVEACEHVVAAALVLAEPGPSEVDAAPVRATAAGSGSAGVASPSTAPAAAQGAAAGSAAVGAAAPAAALAARVGYRFGRDRGQLAYRRVLVSAEGETPLTARLAFLAKGRGEIAVAAGAKDLAVERAMEGWREWILPREVVPRLFPLLADDVLDVRFEDQPVRVLARPVEPVVARVEDQGDGFRLVVVRNRAIDEFFPAAARLGATLRPLAPIRLNAPERERLPRGRHFTRREVGELVSTIIPSLAERCPVEIVATRLPGVAKLAPRIVVETRESEGRLAATAWIVYGRPATARIEDGRVAHIAGPLPLRDEEAEREAARRLADALDLVPEIERTFADEAAIAFAERLRRWDGEVVGDAHRRLFLAPPLAPRLAPRGDDVEIAFASPGEDGAERRARPELVVAVWRRGDHYVPLEDGGYAPLPAAWLAAHGALVADILAAKNANGGALPRAALPDLARLCEEIGAPPPPGFAELRALADDFAGLPAAPAPPDLAAELRPYQRRGVDWLAFLKRARLGGLLADDMGLGKTLQAICVFERPTLVVCPASVLFNWEAEIKRFRPALTVNVHHGAARALDPAADVTLTTYALLRNDADALAAVDWKVVALDEAQAIKNPDSQAARAAHRLRGEFRVALTGTPVENRLAELWSVMQFACPGLLGTRDDFEARVERPIEDGDAAAAARLRARIKPFALRRLKREVAPELPPRTEIDAACELSPEERDVYDAVRAAARAEALRLVDAGGSTLAALEALLRLRQAACHPALVPGRSAETSSKVDELMERLETVVADEHKALVFSQWTSLLDLVEPHLERSGIAFARLDGATRDRGAVVGSFQDPAGPPVLLVSLKAGGVGLNLTAADHVFLLDPWWNPAAEDQAIDRAHRIGQEKPVFVHRLVAKDTVEERLLALQDRKRALAAAALSGAESGAAAALTRDDLLALLAD